jgi:hypothetical protein
LEPLDEGVTPDVRRHPHSESRLKGGHLFEMSRNIAQLAQDCRRFVIPCARSSFHGRTSPMSVLILLIVDLLEALLAQKTLPLAPLLLPLGSYPPALGS